MKLSLSPSAAIELETIANQTRGHEFSGIGRLSKNGDGMVVEDIVLLDVGSQGLTEISANDLYEVSQMEGDWRVWFHRHPVGNGKPGGHNWSFTDETTIQTSPLGGIPQAIKWSVSIVRTPGGWVGRIDNHISGKTVHLPVEGQGPVRAYKRAGELLEAYEIKEAKRYTRTPKFRHSKKQSKKWRQDAAKWRPGVGPVSKKVYTFIELVTCAEDYIDEDWFDYLYNISVDVNDRLGYDLIPEDFDISDSGEVSIHETGLVLDYLPFEFLAEFKEWCRDMENESTATRKGILPWLPRIFA
jgi:hypothetical protein